MLAFWQPWMAPYSPHRQDSNTDWPRSRWNALAFLIWLPVLWEAAGRHGTFHLMPFFLNHSCRLQDCLAEVWMGSSATEQPTGYVVFHVVVFDLVLSCKSSDAWSWYHVGLTFAVWVNYKLCQSVWAHCPLPAESVSLLDKMLNQLTFRNNKSKVQLDNQTNIVLNIVPMIQKGFSGGLSVKVLCNQQYH